MVQYVVTLKVTMEAETPDAARAAAETAAWQVDSVTGVESEVKQGYVPLGKLSDEQILNFEQLAYRVYNRMQHGWIMGAQPKPKGLVLADKKYRDLFGELERRGYDAMECNLANKLVKKVA